MPLKIYLDWMSQPSRALVAFCLMNKIPYEVVETKIAEGKTRSPEFKMINPLGKVPAIDDDGFKLFESHTILRYLARKHNVPTHWYPTDPKGMALVDRYLDWHHSYLRNGSSTTVFNTLFAPRMGITKNVNLEDSRKLMLFSLTFIDQFYLGKNKFIAGDQISIAFVRFRRFYCWEWICQGIRICLLGSRKSWRCPRLKKYIRCSSRCSKN